MPRKKIGGTTMYCPNCEKCTTCAARSISSLGFQESSAQRYQRTDYTDIHWFRRGRVCLVCDEEFLTAEIQEDFLDELVELRDSLKQIKLHAENYLKESTEASASLTKLSESLSVLRALKVYKQVPEWVSNDIRLTEEERLLIEAKDYQGANQKVFQRTGLTLVEILKQMQKK